MRKWLTIGALVVMGVFGYWYGDRDQRRRSEVAEQRADSLAFELHAEQFFSERFALDRDSLAHLADSLRARRTYWYWRAHTK